MSEPTCRWDREAERHLLRSHLPACASRACRGCEPCLRDEHGNPIRHCRQRWSCHGHLEFGENTCAGCRALIRQGFAKLCDLQSLMLTQAIADGVDSDAASLAGPSANPVTAQWRLVNMSRAGLDVEELDWRDPYTAVTARERMIREDYGHDLDTLVSPTLTQACAYISGQLTRMSRDDSQADVLADLLTVTRELGDHLEAVLHNSRHPERGAPCPECASIAEDGKGPRLVKYHGASEAWDRWVCPRDRAHWWLEGEYRMRVATEYLSRAEWLSAAELRSGWGIKAGTLRQWHNRGQIQRQRRGTEIVYHADTAVMLATGA